MRHLRALCAGGLIASLALCLTLLAAPEAYDGAAPGDLTRGVTPSDIQPPLLDDRAYLDGYTLWYQGDAGDSLMVSILLSNLAGLPPRPGFSMDYYPASGPPVHGELEMSGDALRLAGPPLDLGFGANHFRQVPGGYDITLRAPSGMALEMSIVPGGPGYRRGNGRVPVEEDTFFMALLAPGGAGRGHLTLPTGEKIKLTGGVYLDHSWQDAWPHKVASKWFNVRFYGTSHRGAVTTWVTPEGVGLSHGVISKGGALRHATHGVGVKRGGEVPDPETGHGIPSTLTLDLGEGVTLEAALGSPLERRDLLGDLNPLLKGAIGALVARPYSWRFRGTGRLTLPGEAGGPVEGVVLAEMIEL